MKKIPFLLFLPAAYCLGIAQPNFQRTYGGAGNEKGHAITTTQDGGIAIAGYTNSFGAGGDDIFILKVDQQGVIQWQKTYGRALDEYGFGVAIMETPDAGLVVTGLTGGNGSQITDVFVFKTDNIGNLLWDFEYDSGPVGLNSADHGRGLLYTADDNIMVFGTDDGGSFGSNDGLAIKIDENGNLIWKKVYGGFSNDHFQHAIELVSGNVVICGSSQSYGPGDVAGYLTKIDPQGNLLWAHSYGGSQFEGFNACDLTNDNNIIAAGITTTFGTGQGDILLCKIDTSGILQWSKTYGGEFNERAASVKSLPDGSGYLILAYTDSYGNGSRDILVIRTNAIGDVVWSRNFGTQGYEGVNDWAYSSLLVTQDDRLVLTGWSDSLSVAGEDVVLIQSNIDGNMFCQDVSIVVTSPNLEMLITNPETASPGNYESIASIVMNSSMISRELCYCLPECNLCEETIVHYDLNACHSILGDASEMDYSEFFPAYPSTLSYASISASIVHRSNAGMNKHSCTPGVEDSPAMCVSSLNSCFYDPGNVQSVVFELTIAPDPDSSVRVTSLSFYEKAPTMFSWINGASGLNNYPTLYAIRILKNNTEIILQADGIATSIDVWSHEVFDFALNDAFVAEASTTFRFELLAYCLVGNIATVTAWDLDEISIAVGCDPVTGASNNISGGIRNPESKPLSNMDLFLSHDPDFQTYLGNATTDQNGQFSFKRIPSGNNLYVRGYHNTDFLNGVSTLDLIHVQKHLLGLQPFTSPYQMIAADANGSNTVSVLDMIDLRKLILGRITELPNNTSWRFAIADQELTLSNPWNYAETFQVPDIGVDIGNAHFVGVKIGDVTGDARSSLKPDHKVVPNSTQIHFSALDQKVMEGQSLKIDISTTDLIHFAGFQFALKLNGLQLQDIISDHIPFTSVNYNFTQEGILNLSWHQIEPISINPDEILFSLLVIPEHSGSLVQMLKLDAFSLEPQIYLTDELEVAALSLDISDRRIASDEMIVIENEPNPFATTTRIRFHLEHYNHVEFLFYDSSGCLLLTTSRYYDAGENTLTISRDDLGIQDGVVFCRLKTPAFIGIHKMVLMN